ncbi:MAG: hypothetical protein U0V73_10775 [Acidimicrobiia bacterium]
MTWPDQPDRVPPQHLTPVYQPGDRGKRPAGLPRTVGQALTQGAEELGLEPFPRREQFDDPARRGRRAAGLSPVTSDVLSWTMSSGRFRATTALGVWTKVRAPGIIRVGDEVMLGR